MSEKKRKGRKIIICGHPPKRNLNVVSDEDQAEYCSLFYDKEEMEIRRRFGSPLSYEGATSKDRLASCYRPIHKIDWSFSDVVEKALITRLEQAGVEIDWEVEKTRMFKSITILEQFNHPTTTMTFFYNNGTVEGLRLLTVEKTYNYDFSNNNRTISETKIH